MDYRFLVFLIFPLIWFVGAKWFIRTTFNWVEFGISCLVTFLLLALFFYTGKYSAIHDTEILNGQVIKKYQRTEDCPGGWNDWPDSFCSNYVTREVRVYPDRCTTDSKGHETCYPRYKTQYKYIYDWERRWYVQDSFTTHQISRVDDQGAKEPQRWTIAYVGEPASTTHGYTNYVQAVPESLFNNTKGVTYDTTIPPIPDEVHDYYRSNHVVLYKANVNGETVKKLNLEIGNILKIAGPSYQANVIVVLTGIDDQSLRYSFERAWVGGNKNDIVIFLGIAPNQQKFTWVDVMTWARNYNNELFQVTLRNALMDYEKGLTDPADMMNVVLSNIKDKYDRPQMKDFEYLKSSIQPPTWVMWFLGVLSVICPIGLTLLFHFNELGTSVANSTRSSYNTHTIPRRFK